MEMMLGVVWAGGGFRVVLDRNYGQGAMSHSLNTLIVEIDVRHFNFRWQTFSTQCKTVIV